MVKTFGKKEDSSGRLLEGSFVLPAHTISI